MGAKPLTAVLRATGTLPPAGVCRLGRDVACALAELHERGLVGAPSLDAVFVDGGRASLALGGVAGGAPEDDLYALGAVLAEAALGHPLGEAGGIRTLGGNLPDRLVDAIEVLVAPPGARLKNARAAERVLSEVERRLGDGGAALAHAYEQALRVGQLRDTAPGLDAKTLEMSPHGILSAEDLRKLGTPSPTPRPVRDTVELPLDAVDDVAPPPRFSREMRWLLVAGAGAVLLAAVAFAAGMHFAH